MQQQQQTPFSEQKAYPKRLDIFLHLFKTGRLLWALLTDGRITLVQKVLFLGSIVLLLVLLFFPDLLGEFIASTVLPLVGTVLGIPLDAGFDWVAFALVVVSLLRVFPAYVVAEHYQIIFG